MLRVHTDWLLTAERAAIHVPTATAVIADVHLGYDRARCRAGEALPAYGVEETLAALKALAIRHPLRRLVIAGDLFEDGRRPTGTDELLHGLREFGLELAGVVPGNHDRGLPHGADRLPIYPDGLDVGGWRVVHGDGPLPRGRVIQGHEHPCLRWQGVAAPCFLVGPRRIVLPAFSADAAGAGVLGDARWRTFRCGVIAGDRVLDLGPVAVLRRHRAGAKRKKA